MKYDNATSHVAVRKGTLSASKMNRTDGGKQPIVTQMSWFETLDVATRMMKRVEQQMWYPGPDGTPIAKGALHICKGHIILFGPKCHPECMHVEMC